MAIEIPELYRQRGSFGNNTTISEEERHAIANSSPESGCEDGRMRLRGEQSLHAFYQEWRMAPEGGNWITYEDLSLQPVTPIWELSLEDQRKTRGILSKSQHNIKRFVEHKPKRARRFIRAQNVG